MFFAAEVFYAAGRFVRAVSFVAVPALCLIGLYQLAFLAVETGLILLAVAGASAVAGYALYALFMGLTTACGVLAFRKSGRSLKLPGNDDSSADDGDVERCPEADSRRSRGLSV